MARRRPVELSVEPPPPVTPPMDPRALEAFIATGETTPLDVSGRLETSPDVQPSARVTRGRQVARAQGPVARRTVYLPADLDAQLEARCRAEGREVSGTIARLVRQWLEDPSPGR